MGTLVYAAITSLDGYIEDASGRFDWAVPDAEVHTFINELERPIGTHLYGRRMYETMAVWQTIDDDPSVSPVELAYARMWRELDKVVYSTTLESVPTPRTRLEPRFVPDDVAHLKRTTELDISISGPSLAQHAFAAGLIDDVHLFVMPIIVGAGKPGLPSDLRMHLELRDERRFASGVVHLHYGLR